jgi:hypothetical protein
MQPEYECDVAISFLHQDEPWALEIADRLGPAVRVFIYSKAQEKLVGLRGDQAFGEIFRRKARLSLVLFRERWGKRHPTHRSKRQRSVSMCSTRIQIT